MKQAQILLALFSIADCFTGKGTYYDLQPGALVACQTYAGKVLTTDIAGYAAINMVQYDNGNACGKCALVTGPSGSRLVKIVDACAGCSYGDIDLSEVGFPSIAPIKAGRVPITWEWADCSGSSPVANPPPVAKAPAVADSAAPASNPPSGKLAVIADSPAPASNPPATTSVYPTSSALSNYQSSGTPVVQNNPGSEVYPSGSVTSGASSNHGYGKIGSAISYGNSSNSVSYNTPDTPVNGTSAGNGSTTSYNSAERNVNINLLTLPLILVSGYMIHF